MAILFWTNISLPREHTFTKEEQDKTGSHARGGKRLRGGDRQAKTATDTATAPPPGALHNVCRQVLMGNVCPTANGPVGSRRKCNYEHTVPAGTTSQQKKARLAEINRTLCPSLYVTRKWEKLC